MITREIAGTDVESGEVTTIVYHIVETTDSAFIAHRMWAHSDRYTHSCAICHLTGRSDEEEK